MKFFLEVFLSLLLLLAIPSARADDARLRVIIDADTANEVDDLYALVRALIEPSWNVIAVHAAHWQTSQWATGTTMEDSHRLNQQLIGYLDPEDRPPTRRGGTARMHDWGDRAQHSAAAYGLIKDAHATPEGEKLTVIAMGALTNIASSLLIDPGIAPKIRLYWLGSSVDYEAGFITALDFNAMMDIQALHQVFDSPVEFHVLPKQVSSLMEFDYRETEAMFKDYHPITDFLLQRWFNHGDGGRYSRHIWDLALIGAMLDPASSPQVKIETSPEFGGRKVMYYRTIDADSVRKDFFETVREYFED